MNIFGLQKLTLLDFPGKTACTVFTGGCNFRCPFCHNASLVLMKQPTTAISESAFFSFLQKRQRVLDGVCISGGEPLINRDLPLFAARIKALGYAVKLDTNGSYPEALRSLVRQGLLDYVAMDIKNSPEKYEQTAGEAGILPRVRESVQFLLNHHVDYEFRTTVVSGLHEDADFHAIGTWLRGARRYYLQAFEDSGDILSPGMLPPSPCALSRFLCIAQMYVPNAALRGVSTQ